MSEKTFDMRITVRKLNPALALPHIPTTYLESMEGELGCSRTLCHFRRNPKGEEGACKCLDDIQSPYVRAIILTVWKAYKDEKYKKGEKYSGRKPRT